MNFFIDFEANQFTNEIISIGCISENNLCFYSLVKPIKRKKPTKFITELTGITAEMAINAPSADKVFSDFYMWVKLATHDKYNNFYCYGNSDITFINSTIKNLKNEIAKKELQTIAKNLIDYGNEINIFFDLPTSIGLNKIFNLCVNNTYEQNHNALDDAKMLKIVYENSKFLSRDKLLDLIPKQYCNSNGEIVSSFAKKVIATEMSTGKDFIFESINEASRFLQKINNAPIKNNAKRIKDKAFTKEVYNGFVWDIIQNQQSIIC